MSNPSGTIHSSFGSWLRQRRREAGIARDDLAERAACSSITLQKIEAGERRPSRQLALILAQVFSVPIDEREAFVAFARAQPQEDHAATPANDHMPANTPAPAHDGVQTQSPWR